MKRIFIFTCLIFAIVSSCSKDRHFYNEDGSQITMEQALEIVKDEVDFYDWVEITADIVKKGTHLYTDLLQARICSGKRAPDQL